MKTPGIHHVTAIAGDPGGNLGFYTGVLGLRQVKRTVNFDDPSTYHLYYGDRRGTPGTTLTFFPFGGSRRGRSGEGQARATAFAIPEESLEYWQDRLAEAGADPDPPRERLGETVIEFRDPDGLALELVAGGSEVPGVEPWDAEIPEEHAIRGFHGVTLDSRDPEATAEVLETLGYEKAGEEADRERYESGGERARVVDLLTRETNGGAPGPGTVHHVAFRVPDEETQDEWRERLREEGLRVTEPKDRRYFRSIYFREPGGVLFEIATDGPGFTRDESVEELGSGLRLPPWLEDERERLESTLPDLDAPRGVSEA